MKNEEQKTLAGQAEGNPAERKPYTRPDLVKVSLNIGNWQGYLIATNNSGDCCLCRGGFA